MNSRNPTKTAISLSTNREDTKVFCNYFSLRSGAKAAWFREPALYLEAANAGSALQGQEQTLSRRLKCMASSLVTVPRRSTCQHHELVYHTVEDCC